MGMRVIWGTVKIEHLSTFRWALSISAEREGWVSLHLGLCMFQREI